MGAADQDTGHTRVSLVIVNYNSAELTKALVRDTEGGADEVIIVDNESPEGAPEGLESIRNDIIVIGAGANLGYGSAANLGSARASGDVLVIANPDVSVRAEDLRTLATEAMRPGVGVVAPRFVGADGVLQRSAHSRDPGLLTTVHELCRPLAAVLRRVSPEWHSTLLSCAAHGTSQDVHHLLGALLAVRATTFRALGGFDENFFLYREETDLCRRARLAGWRNRHVAAVTVTHLGGGSTKDDSVMMSRPVALDSHYRFIAKHWGATARRVAWIAGVVSSLAWAIGGGERAAGRRALRWHLGPGR